MFTGIVEEVGIVRALNGARLEVDCRGAAMDSEVGASVAVGGVCITVIERTGDRLAFDLSLETLSRTTLGELSPGDGVNLERPLRLSDRLGGHLVQGHVDGIGRVESLVPEEGGATLTVRYPEDLARYLVEKGSVTVDGVSLTITSVAGGRFSVALIPHTLAATTLGALATGDGVNLEADVVAKYVGRMLPNVIEGGDR
jgi:riboflavin synthase